MSVKVNNISDVNITTNSIHSGDVLAIINGKTTKVKELQSNYKLGALGYHVHKALESIKSLFGKETQTLIRMKKAEGIDRLPEAIKVTAAKIESIMSRGNYIPGKINQAKLYLESDRPELSHAPGMHLRDTKNLQQAMKDLCRYGATLANLHGKGSTLQKANTSSAKAWTDALASLVMGHSAELKEAAFLPLHFVAEATKQLALPVIKQPEKVVALAEQLDTFVAATAQSLGLDKAMVKTHAYKVLSSMNLDQQVFGESSEPKAVASATRKTSEELSNVGNEINKLEDEIKDLRGPTGNDGQIHKNWLAYIRKHLELILVIDKIKTPYEDRLINEGEKEKIIGLLKNTQGDDNLLHDEEAFCLEITRRNDAAKLKMDLTHIASANLPNVQPVLDKWQEVQAARATFDKSLQRLHDLAGVHCQGLQDPKVSCELTKLQNKVEELKQNMEETESKTKEEFAASREQSNRFFATLEKARTLFEAIANNRQQEINVQFNNLVEEIERQ